MPRRLLAPHLDAQRCGPEEGFEHPEDAGGRSQLRRRAWG